MENAAGLLAKVLPPGARDDAVLDAVVLSSCADGVTRSELDALSRMARELPSLRDASDDEVAARVRASFDRIEAAGLEESLRALGDAGKDEEAKRQIFSAAVIIQYADGHVTKEENEFLLDLADVLGLSETKVRELVSSVERELGLEG